MPNQQILFSPTVGNTSPGGSGPGSLELTIPIDGTGGGTDGITNFYYQWPTPTTGTDWTGVTVTAWVYTADISPSTSVSAFVGVGNGNAGNNQWGTAVPLILGDGGASAWQELSLVVPAAYASNGGAWDPTQVNQIAIYFDPTAYGPADGGAGSMDAGTGSVDGGAAPADGGPGSVDSGPEPMDGGARPADGGTGSADAGTGPVDAGTAPVDSGTAPVDSGTAPVAAGTGWITVYLDDVIVTAQ